MALYDYLVTDDLTIILALVAAGLFLLHNLYKPQALVHPILLGRQSDVARVRNPSESAVYRNYGTGMLGRVSPASLSAAAVALIFHSFLCVLLRTNRSYWISSNLTQMHRERCGLPK